MYGMVNRAIKDLVVDSAGPEVWERIWRRAGMESGEFQDSTVYDDALTYDLVAAASDVLDVPADDVLKSFGRHWILFTGQEGWGPILDTAGADLRSFVAGLDALHARVQGSMPACRMPSFGMEERSDGCLEVLYRSDRPGLAPMVIGLLDGLVERFGERWAVEHVGPRADGVEIFLLTPEPAAIKGGVTVGGS